MTPIQFEQLYERDWDELRAMLGQLRGSQQGKPRVLIQGERIASLYRRTCEHLALARARSYPAYRSIVWTRSPPTPINSFTSTASTASPG